MILSICMLYVVCFNLLTVQPKDKQFIYCTFDIMSNEYQEPPIAKSLSQVHISMIDPVTKKDYPSLFHHFPNGTRVKYFVIEPDVEFQVKVYSPLYCKMLKAIKLYVDGISLGYNYNSDPREDSKSWSRIIAARQHNDDRVFNFRTVKLIQQE